MKQQSQEWSGSHIERLLILNWLYSLLLILFCFVLASFHFNFDANLFCPDWHAHKICYIFSECLFFSTSLNALCFDLCGMMRDGQNMLFFAADHHSGNPMKMKTIQRRRKRKKSFLVNEMSVYIWENEKEKITIVKERVRETQKKHIQKSMKEITATKTTYTKGTTRTYWKIEKKNWRVRTIF